MQQVILKSYDAHSRGTHGLRSAVFTIKPKKAKLCRTRVNYLGFIIEPGICKPEPQKVACIRSFPVPNNPNKVMQFLGLGQFYTRFISHFNRVSEPLRKLLRKNEPFVQTDKCNVAFEKFRNSLEELAYLKLPYLNRKFIIKSDSCRSGLGAVLLQEQDGQLYPIYYASRS